MRRGVFGCTLKIAQQVRWLSLTQAALAEGEKLRRNTMDTTLKPQLKMSLIMKESTSPVIETRGLTKTYKGVQALKPLDLQVQQNSICGFLGPNGAGKTTTIKLLLGLAKPTGGSGRVFGMDIRKESDEIRRRVGYLSQDPRYYEHMTARETLRFVARFFYEGPRAEIES
jgi:ABC-type transporter Mla maintaining outer membrane lipid asymmetry ATPase subunit MlaF